MHGKHKGEKTHRKKRQEDYIEEIHDYNLLEKQSHGTHPNRQHKNRSGQRNRSERNKTREERPSRGRRRTQETSEDKEDLFANERAELLKDIEEKNISHREILQRLSLLNTKAQNLPIRNDEKVDLEALKRKFAENINEKGEWNNNQEVNGTKYRDMREPLWVSIDNDDTRDIDQLTVAVEGENGEIKIMVAIADVDVIVPMNSELDDFAASISFSVYTPARVFTMIPTILCYDMTSLNPDVDRFACIVEMTFNKKTPGKVVASEVYFGVVRNKAKLAYRSVGEWLEGRAEPPALIAANDDIKRNIMLQNKISQEIKEYRKAKGSLVFDRGEGEIIWEGDMIKEIAPPLNNSATQLIENFMVAANGVTSRYLESKGLPTIQRVVKDPERWDMIVEVAKKYHYTLPNEPDGKKLRTFLMERFNKEPVTFPDLSLQIIKLMGRGEYEIKMPNDSEAGGHFGLAVKHYSHSTAPNRRFPDLVTQRLLKYALLHDPGDGKIIVYSESGDHTLPYSENDLSGIAQKCTENEQLITRVERQLKKSVAILLLQNRVGETFNAVVTGAMKGKGVYCRVLDTLIEGKVVRRQGGLAVGDIITVKLVSVNLMRSFIDFENLQRRKRANEHSKPILEGDELDDDNSSGSYTGSSDFSSSDDISEEDIPNNDNVNEL